MVENLVILGAGGFAREVIWLVDCINGEVHRKVGGLNMDTRRWNIIAYWNVKPELPISGVPVLDAEGIAKLNVPFKVIAAIGDSRKREDAVMEAWEMECSFATLIHPTALVGNNVRMGEGTIICAGATITVDIAIGEHVIVNLNSFVGHDSILEDFVTLSGMCYISGNTTLRRGVYFGSGTGIKEGLEVGEYSFIGLGAAVISNIPAGMVAVGVPAKVIREV